MKPAVWWGVLVAGALLFGLTHPALPISGFLGDLDGDGKATSADVVLLVNHLSGSAPLSTDALRISDINLDGITSAADLNLLITYVVTGQPLPQALVRMTTSPFQGEADVAVSRETVFEFSAPLQAAGVDANNIYAHFGVGRLPGNVHLSKDRKTVKLFYTDSCSTSCHAVPTPAGGTAMPADLPPSARIRVTVRGDKLISDYGTPPDVDNDGQPGGTASLDFDTVNVSPVAGTRACGRIFATKLVRAEHGSVTVNVPMQDVEIIVDGAPQLRTVTDSMGNFCLDPAPAGRFFVNITADRAVNPFPEGSFPYIGNAWECPAGVETNVGTFYMPLLQDDALVETSATEYTQLHFAQSVLVEFPEFADVQLTIPPDSIYSVDGRRGGPVGIMPVPPDRLPGELSEGLWFPVVISIQSDEDRRNFDQPCPICFPNLPDRNGTILAAGDKSSLWSFNHDAGRWEVIGPMTVTPDGRLICTDPGVGVKAPGWHGAQPGNAGNGPPPWRPRQNDPCQAARDSTDNAVDDCVNSTIIGLGINLLEAASVVGAPVAAALGCASNVTFALTSVLDGCRPGATASRDDCVMGVFGGALNLAGCIPPLGNAMQAIGCVTSIGTAAAQASNACATGSSTQRSLTESALSDLAANLNLQVEVLESYRTFYLQVFGDAVWFESGWDRPQYQTFREALLQAASPAGPGGFTFTATEMQTLLPLAPPTIEAAQLQALSAHLLASSQGASFEPQDAATAGLAFLNQLNSVAGAGWLTPLDGLRNLAEGSTEEALIRENANAAPLDRRHWYRLVDTLRGTQVRGQTSNTGAINSATLAADTWYSVEYVETEDFRVARTTFLSPITGSAVSIPLSVFRTSTSPDSDGDGLTDEAEAIIGTSPNLTDTDGDGVTDSAELRAGTNPLDGLVVGVGIIAAADTSGTARDIATLNDLAAIADGEQGVTVFNIFNRMNPVRLSQVLTGGTATRVAIWQNQVATALGENGLAVLDITNPPAAFVKYNKPASLFGGPVRAVAMSGGLIFVGTEYGRVVVVDERTGDLIDDLEVGTTPVEDIFLAGDHVYILSQGRLSISPFLSGGMSVLGWVDTQSVLGAGLRPFRLFVADGIAYATDINGYTTFDVSDPANPTLITGDDTAQRGWKQIVANGSGLGIAAVSPNSTDDGPHNIGIYDVSDPNSNDRFLAQIVTPGIASAVAIYNGLAYVADSEAGMQVLSYLPFETGSTPPTISLETNLGGSLEIEEEKYVRVTARVSDDVQVRNVEFYIGDQRIETDGNYPFETRLLSPRLSQQSRMLLRARVTDTNGNATWASELNITILEDSTAPTILSVTPRDGAYVPSSAAITVFFNEPMASSSFGTAFQITEAGPDGLLETPDDEQRTDGVVSYLPELMAARVSFLGGIGPGFFRVMIDTSPTDSAGNSLLQSRTWSFRALLPETDDDDDCLPNLLELALGLNPFEADSDGNGTDDGLEDFDADGLSNCAEVALGTNLRDADSDGDFLLDGAEVAAGTDPTDEDTDGDSYLDNDELLAGTDPLDPASKPSAFVISATPATVAVDFSPLDYPTLVVGSPLVTVSVDFDPSTLPTFVVGQPPVTVRAMNP